jgi:hypothetical protein
LGTDWIYIHFHVALKSVFSVGIQYSFCTVVVAAFVAVAGAELQLPLKAVVTDEAVQKTA